MLREILRDFFRAGIQPTRRPPVVLFGHLQIVAVGVFERVSQPLADHVGRVLFVQLGLALFGGLARRATELHEVVVQVPQIVLDNRGERQVLATIYSAVQRQGGFRQAGHNHSQMAVIGRPQFH